MEGDQRYSLILGTVHASVQSVECCWDGGGAYVGLWSPEPGWNVFSSPYEARVGRSERRLLFSLCVLVRLELAVLPTSPRSSVLCPLPDCLSSEPKWGTFLGVQDEKCPEGFVCVYVYVVFDLFLSFFFSLRVTLTFSKTLGDTRRSNISFGVPNEGTGWFWFASSLFFI